jgi:ankyrin repeat protein
VYASPPCIVPRFVRGKIGSSTRKSASISTWGMETCRFGLDFVQLLLEAGADPNARDHLGATPLMCATKDAPGAAKFLLNWPTTDANITMRSGESFLAGVRKTVKYFSDEVARPDNPTRVPHQFLLRQWREIEEMLVERRAAA